MSTTRLTDNHPVPVETVCRSPSVEDGSLTFQEELEQRSYACGRIQKAAILLGVGMQSTANAQVILHRFFYRRSMKDFDVKIVATTAVYLACKLAETPRRVQDIIAVHQYLDWLEIRDQKAEAMLKRGYPVDQVQQEMDQSNEQFEFLPKEAKKVKELQVYVFRVERHILRETGFLISLILVHPHSYILQYIHAIFGKAPERFKKSIAQKAWAYLNDR